MNSPKCDEVRGALIGYIEMELSGEEQDNIAGHLAHCDECNQEYGRLQAMLKNLKDVAVPDPGESFWNEFPQNILEEVREKKARQVAGHIIDFYRARHKHPSREAQPAAPVAEPAHGKANWLKAALAMAAILLLAINVLTFTPKPETLWFDSAAFLAKLQTSGGLSTLNIQSESAPAARFGFAEQQRPPNAFDAGQLLAQTILHLKTGDTLAARGRIDRLFSQLQQTRVPSRVTAHLGQVLEAMDTGKSGTLLIARLNTFQQNYEKVIMGESYQDLVLFRAGLWTFNVELAAAAKSRLLIHSVNESGQLQYLQKAFARMPVAPGVSKSLKNIEKHAANRPLVDGDFTAIKRSVNNLRSLLSLQV